MSGIIWTPTMNVGGAFSTIKNAYYDAYSGPIPVNQSSGISGDWKGPVWRDLPINNEAYPQDQVAINEFFAWLGVNQNSATTTTTTTTLAGAKPPLVTCSYITQTQVRDGMWWAVESSPFLRKNQAFYVTILKPSPPTSESRNSFIVIRFGETDPKNCFDIWLSSNMKPRIIDYLLPANQNPPTATATETVNTGPVDPNTRGFSVEFMEEQSRILSSEKEIEVAVMVVAGRLVVYVNKNQFIYTRINKDSEHSGELLECKIPAGGISVYGTNTQATINASPMVFSPLACFALPIPKTDNAGGNANGVNIAVNSGNWYGINKQGNAEGSVCKITSTAISGGYSYGCDCGAFYDENGVVYPEGQGYHLDGIVSFSKGSSDVFTNLLDSDFYYLAMWTGTSLAVNDKTVYDKCPYFFRIAGTKKVNPLQIPSIPEDVSDKIISVDETDSAVDYYHIKKTVNITMYGGDGLNYRALVNKQFGITVSWGWDGNLTKTFTGVIAGVTSNLVAGKEIVNLTCEDYMYILKNTIIVNSPFYDGMVAFYALKDLAKRGGIRADLSRNSHFGDDFFLPAGFSFSKPKMRFGGRDSIETCMLDILKRFETFMYFDAEGKLFVEKLPGGLFSTNGLPAIKFVSNISSVDANAIVILGERNVTTSYDSTVSNISVITVDRNTRNPIVHARSSTYDVLGYNRPFLIDQPALGELDAARAWVLDLSARMFKPVIKTTVKSASAFTMAIKPLDFITVDGHNFRVMSIKRSFSAENNDLMTVFEGEWLGG